MIDGGKKGKYRYFICVFGRYNFALCLILPTFVLKTIRISYLELLLFIISFFLCVLAVYLLVKTRQSNRENEAWIARELEEKKNREVV